MEPRDASAGRQKAVALPPSAAWWGLMTGGGRTGAVGSTHRVASRLSGQRPAAQPVSTKSRFEVHRRMMMRRGAPQVGQRTTRGCGGRCEGGWSSLEWVCMLIKRMVRGGMAPLAWRKPKCRTFMKPSGQTCWRTRRRNSMTSRWAVRGRALPTFRYVKVTVRPLRPPIRLLAIATRQTAGARSVKAV